MNFQSLIDLIFELGGSGLLKQKRQDFNNPTPNSVLCVKHFTSDCYPAEYQIKKYMGFEVKKKCRMSIAVPTNNFAGAVSNILVQKRSSQDNDLPTSRPLQAKKTRSAYRKREFQGWDNEIPIIRLKLVVKKLIYAIGNISNAINRSFVKYYVVEHQMSKYAATDQPLDDEEMISEMFKKMR